MSLDMSFRSYPFDRIKRLYDINVHGAFFTAREAARNMIPQGGGSIVLVSSMSANVSGLVMIVRYFLLNGMRTRWIDYQYSSASNAVQCVESW